MEELKMTETEISKVLIEGEYATIMGVKYKRVEEPKTAVEEAYKDWWGQYPELETDSEYDEMRWQGFRAGFHFAYEEKVKEDDYYNEVETHKSQPRMNLKDTVTGEVVSCNDEIYYRLQFNDESHNWFKKREKLDGNLLKQITDGETYRLLEGLWFNDVKKEKV
jgi:hypothetical protein